MILDSLHLKNDLQLRFDEQIFRNVLRTIAYRRIRRPGVAGIHNIKLAVSDVINVPNDVQTCMTLFYVKVDKV